ncbi:hypothetical protein Q6350_14705 [Isoptericola sp. b515]|uniref:hypothetical protein n=1 Tax=Isoptericola sp. b515 TaxID=3064652 RepID=UPI002712323C|nr:hypothetical protein [Isoptericola sp. b515]MDO8149683.1 hypothetical protein [Isoptericola sp. b515]
MSAGGFLAAVDQESRRAQVRGVPGLDGVDFVEVLSNHRGSAGYVPSAPQQRTLLVHLVNGPVPADWSADRVEVLGGVRSDPALNPVAVEWAYPAERVLDPTVPLPDPALPHVGAGDRELVDRALRDPAGQPDTEARARAFVVRTSSPGDWSTYTLRLVDSADAAGSAPPPGFDVALATAPFTFTVDCPTDLDCAPGTPGAPTDEDLLPGDYLARDYEGLRTRLLDRVATLLPGWTDDGPADPAVMLVELFAAVGDRLAAWQDAVAVEAYLGTARRRTSVRRHARLLGYTVHEGCSARALLAFTTPSGQDVVEVPAGTPVTDLPGRVEAGSPLDAADQGATVYETMTRLTVRAVRDALPLYAWGGSDHRLPAGTTAAFVATGLTEDPRLRRGDLLVLAEQPADGTPGAGPPDRRYAVRLVRDAERFEDELHGVAVWQLVWSRDDALRGPLQVRAGDPAAVRAVALANVVVADHGATVVGEPLVPPSVPASRAYRPRLRRPGLAPVDPRLPEAASASALLSPDPTRAGAAMSLWDGRREWIPRPDLVGSGRLAAHVVVEPEPGGVSRLRFGDGLNGRRPTPGSELRATYRIGGGPEGRVGAGRLVRVLPAARPDAVLTGPPPVVWNPLPSSGGAAPESLEQVRQLAPAAFRTQRRAVTSRDYAVVAELDPGTQRAVSRRRWTGSWYAQEVTLDPLAGADDESLRAAVTAELEVRRTAGVDVELERPVHVPLDLVLTGCVRPGYPREDVEQRLREVFSSGVGTDGRRGFFHPDRFTFGDPLRLSDVVATATAVDGVAWVEPDRFTRAGATRAQAAADLAAGVIVMQPRELLRCDSDVNEPEAGRVVVHLGGGS